MKMTGIRPLDATVAISTFERPERLLRCVAALLSGIALPRELVIVDQSASDRTASLVSCAGWDRLVDLRYVRSDSAGLGASRNAAIANSSCPLVLFTDDDCVPHHEWVSAVVGAFSAPHAPDVVTGRVLPLDDDGTSGQSVSTRTRAVAAQFRGLTLPWCVGTGGNAAIRREWLDQVGGFNERLGAGSPGQSAEDMDLFYRLLRAGARARYEPRAIVFHERKEQPGLTRRARSYGFGMGAFCAMRARQGDVYAWWIAARWCVDRARMFGGACCLRRWPRAAYELRAIRSAWQGIPYGLKVGRAAQARGAQRVTPLSAGWLTHPEAK
jgi:GT2 family glycosyltransferase